MRKLTTKRMLTIGAVALAVVLGGGAAIAASGNGSASPSAFLDSVAQHLGISSKKLNDAVKAAAVDQVDAALKEGRITKAQADELKARIESGDVPLLGHGFGLHGHMGVLGFDKLSAAADYLGLTEAQLREKLAAGQSLADVAKAEGKSVDGLKNAILDAAKKKLDQAVKDGVLTQTQADELLDGLKSRIDDLVNRSFERMHAGPGFFGGFHGGFRMHRFDGPPSSSFGTNA